MAQMINTNIASLNSQNSLTKSQSSLTTSLQRLSSGLRINSAKDDAAGLAISERMNGQIKGMNQAVRNANDAVSMSQTAEGGMQEVSNILLRMRELAVQSANDTNSASDRSAIQDEVNQLTSEIDRISGAAEFNGIKLLDGSAGKRTFQVGANADQNISFSLGEVSTSSLRLGGSSTGVGGLTSGRITADGAYDSQLKINGTSIDFNDAGTDDSIGEYVTAINKKTAETGVTATAFNRVEGTKGATGAVTGMTITVETADGSATATSAAITAKDMNDLVEKINSQAIGVTASLGKDGQLVLSNETGGKITVANSDKSGIDAEDYEGYLSLTSNDGSKISVSGSVSSLAADDTNPLSKFGFNETAGTNSVKAMGELLITADAANAGAGMTSATTDLNTAQGSYDPDTVAVDDRLTINGVEIGKTASGTAMDKAAAINALTDQTGVSATARTELKLELNFAGTGTPRGTININGVDADISGANIGAVVTEINTNSGVQTLGITASADENGMLVLTSESGQDIFVANNDIAGTGAAGILNAFLPNGTKVEVDDGGGVPNTGTIAARGVLTLEATSASAITIAGDKTTALDLFGFTAQGGAEAANNGKLSVATQADANEAIKRIDDAIGKVTTMRAQMGAVQNRFSSVVSSLQTSSENITAARSRIVDADFAAETANMTRAQILQQAGTAMLAQANQLPNGVLSLLR
ncbi:flagellin [Aromatoleum bremense]|uniref:Flagellin n=1 Tax=Aromatoleum bremense TaxID=76115 RepID=A0ABX1P0P0_9RHOO|nr:flagellin [Aromatoleum bremense]NMG17467.1 flagellin [Aromatoleum bremense]QTQ30851.1 Flagellin domain-containing protein [Aromatoleum bremense]